MCCGGLPSYEDLAVRTDGPEGSSWGVAGRTRSARNREVIFPRVPSPQVTVTDAFLPAASASALGEEGSSRYFGARSALPGRLLE